MIRLKDVADKKGTLEGMYMYAIQKTISFSPPLQLRAIGCSLRLEVNLLPLKFFLAVVITSTEPRLYVNLSSRGPSQRTPTIT